MGWKRKEGRKREEREEEIMRKWLLSRACTSEWARPKSKKKHHVTISQFLPCEIGDLRKRIACAGFGRLRT